MFWLAKDMKFSISKLVFFKTSKFIDNLKNKIQK